MKLSDIGEILTKYHLHSCSKNRLGKNYTCTCRMDEAIKEVEGFVRRAHAADALSADKAVAIAWCDCEFDEDKEALLEYARRLQENSPQTEDQQPDDEQK